MINREFWEKVASVWSEKEEIKIPDIIEGPDVPEEQIDLDDVEDWDALLKDFFEMD